MPEGTLVVNASPIIFLEQVGGLDWLARLARVVIVPAAVLGEIVAGSDLSPGLTPQRLSVQFQITPDLSLPSEIAGWDLGAGESQVLATVRAGPGREAVLDDRQARRCARSLGLLTTGTLGIILRAKKAGLISEARPVVESLLQSKMHLTRDLVEIALAGVDE